jgi:uncharacterized protein (DUF488 family)
MKMNTQKPRIYSIGYSAYSIDSFINILQKYQINVIADVRSQPYSQFKPEFNRENLKQTLKKVGIKYVFLGDNVGARIAVPECYKNGQADYQLIAENPLFKEGLDRIRKGTKKFLITLMCAEKDPINCHRAILICRYLRNDDIEIIHIKDDDTIENHKETEIRLMKSFRLDQPDFFISDSERLEEAYNRQGEKIAFKKENNDEAS